MAHTTYLPPQRASADKSVLNKGAAKTLHSNLAADGLQPDGGRSD
jgi:hypothetical protein